jgi:hypothetical protein
MKVAKVEVGEQQLEDLIRRHADEIEAGLVYIDHQRQTDGGRLDVILADSGKALVIAELKVTEDDGMLLQGVDYYDYVTRNIERLAREYKQHQIDPTQEVRLLLIAPSFSQTLINRCRWVNIPISLFAFTCLKFPSAEDITPIFMEQQIPSIPEVEEIHTVPKHLEYITDPAAQARVKTFLEEVKGWKSGHETMDAIKYAISLKVDNRVFAYVEARRKHFIVSTFNAEDKWTAYPVHSDEDMEQVRQFAKASMERKAR